MLPGMQTNSCGTTWFVRNREEEAFPALAPSDSMDSSCDASLDSVHLSGPTAEEAPPLPTRVRFSGRDPFKPPVNPGQQVVDAARSIKPGTPTCTLVGQLKGLQGTSDGNNMCADFATTMQRKFGRLKGHYMSVPLLQSALPKEGWKRIPANQARPGDLAITNRGNHIELVAANGGQRLIGSNNWGQTRQSIREHAQDPSQAIYWGRR